MLFNIVLKAIELIMNSLYTYLLISYLTRLKKEEVMLRTAKK